MKQKWLLALALAALLMVVLGTAVIAQGEEPPPPYAGLKNPFPWNDSSAQSAGGNTYKQSCLGCHGVKGNNLSAFDFSKPDYAQRLEARPDFYFWITSEGRLAKGMPGFKSSLSEEQRWQLLTYIKSLGSAAPSGSTPAAPVEVKGRLQLTAPQQAEPGHAVALKANLQDEQAKPIANATVIFFLDVNFFATGLMEIGEAVTDGQGVAVLEYTPKQGGELAAVARYGASEARANVSIPESESAYEPEAGLHFPALSKDIIYPKSLLPLREMGQAPLPVLRLPGGIFSWLFILVATVFMIWFTYFRAIYQVFRIPIVSEIRDINTRLVPMLGMAFVITIGVILILKLFISPYSHLHLPLF